MRIRARAVAPVPEVLAALASRTWLPSSGRWLAPTVSTARSGSTEIAVDLPEDPARLTYWSLALSNLVDKVEGREMTGGVDLTSDVLGTEVVIAGPKDEVFESLIDPETFERWFGLPLRIELYEGGSWAIGDGPAGTVVELVADRRLVVTEDAATVTWDLSEVDEGTLLALRLRGAGDAPPYATWMGWLSGVAQLRRLHEVPDRCPIWVTD